MKRITPELLNNIENVMHSGKDRYAEDEMEGFFSKAIKAFPKNDSPEIVVMKISLIDSTNSTNLSRLLGNKEYNVKGKKVTRKVFTLTELVKKIVSISDFDERIKNGDVSLVSELTKWGKDNGLNIMSFFSKYCLYHNYYVYNKDDYSIFDSVVRDNLGSYITKDEFKILFPEYKREPKDLARTVANLISKMKDNCDYEAYHKLIGDILKFRNINEKDVPKMRRKLDLLVWYMNR